MTISEIKRVARLALQGKWGLAIGIFIIVYFISSVPMTVINLLISGAYTLGGGDQIGLGMGLGLTLVSLLLMIVCYLAVIPLLTALFWFYLNLVRGYKQDLSDVFLIYRNSSTVFKVIGVMLLQGIFVFLWSLLFVIPGYIKAMSYSQALYLLKDHPEYTVLQAITESRRRMNGYKGKYFLMHLSFIGWGLLCVLTFGIGYVWLYPYVMASTAAFYNEIIAPQDYQGTI